MAEELGHIRAVLKEIKQALERLRTTGETYTIYIEKTGLSSEEVVEVLETLGKGHVTIQFEETDQPVSWYETMIHGVWVGVFRNPRNEAIVYTVEIGKYPMLAQSFDEDIDEGMKELQSWIDASLI